MGPLLAAVLTVAVGGVLAFQAPLNAHLAAHSSVVVAAFVSFLVGTVLLGVLLVVLSDAGQFRALARVPPIYFAGGLCGALFVAAALAMVRPLGASGLVAASVLGQLAASAVIDRFGLFGLARTAISPLRVCGLLLILAGMALVLVTGRG
jgi:transporter family-2 protein